MFAIVETGGKQYRVAPNDKLIVEKLVGDVGTKIILEKVLQFIKIDGKKNIKILYIS